MKENVLLKALNAFTNTYKKLANDKLTNFKNQLTPEQIQMIGDELSSLGSLSEKLTTMLEAEPDNTELKDLKTQVDGLVTALDENQTAFENKIIAMVEKKTEKQFINFIQQAVEAKVFENRKTNEIVARTHFKNVNNANINVVYNDTEVGIMPSQVPTLLDYVRQININGENSIAWNEVDGTTDASAIVAIGDGKPVRNFDHVTHTAAGSTLAVIGKLPNQYAKAISMLADIYMNDMSKDLSRKLNSTLVGVLAAGSDLSDLIATLPTVQAPQLIDAIRIVASAIQRLFPENRVVIGLSQSALFLLDSVKDKNDNYVTYDFAQKGIDLVSMPIVDATFTDTTIIGMSQNVVRWYNDGIINKTSTEAYWANNQIGLMIEILNSAFVLRATDAKATVFDDYATIIEDLKPHA